MFILLKYPSAHSSKCFKWPLYIQNVLLYISTLYRRKPGFRQRFSTVVDLTWHSEIKDGDSVEVFENCEWDSHWYCQRPLYMHCIRTKRSRSTTGSNFTNDNGTVLLHRIRQSINKPLNLTVAYKGYSIRGNPIPVSGGRW